MARKMASFVVAIVLSAFGLTVVTSIPAHATSGDPACGSSVPTAGSVQARWLSGSSFSATLEFKLNSDQLASIQCASDYLEIDFQIRGFYLQRNWSDYQLITNLPGGIKDTTESDTDNQVNPGVTGIQVHSLTAGSSYFATISWQAEVQIPAIPYVTFAWVPVYWVGTGNPAQAGVCLWGIVVADHSFCYYGYDQLSERFNDRVTDVPSGMFKFDPVAGSRWYGLFAAVRPNASVQYNGGVHAFYHDSTRGTLQHGWTDVGGWHFETLDGLPLSPGGHNTYVGQYISATVDDTIHLFYYDRTNGLRHAWWAYWNNRWEFEVLDPDANAGRHVTAVVYGGLHVFYYEALNGDLKHKWYQGGVWLSETLDSSGDVGQYISANVYGGLHLFYYDVNGGNLRHAWYGSVGWSFENLDTSGDTGRFTSAIVNGTQHVFYYDATNGDLRHAWWAYWNNRWEFETIDSLGDVGRYSSVLVYGDLHIFYYGASTGDLKHAFYQGGWVLETLDGTPDTGRYAVSAMFGTPHVLYHDSTNGNLCHGFWASWANQWQLETLDGASGTPGGLSSNVL